MTTSYFAESALLPTGWAPNVRFEVDAAGLIAKATPRETPSVCAAR
jgi:hypothetical protein